MSDHPITDFDGRFSAPEAKATTWKTTVNALEEAELYWIATVRGGGEPHVTPLVGVWTEDAIHICTGPREQKAINLETNPHVAVTTGVNTWNAGLDVVIEGDAERLTEPRELQMLADAYLAKYGEDWKFEVGDEGFGSGDDWALVFRIAPTKVLGFAKNPHAQTAYHFQ